MRFGFFILVLAVAGGCSFPKSGGRSVVGSPSPEENFSNVSALRHNTLYPLADPQMHDSPKWLDEGIMASEAYPNLQTSRSVLDHLGVYGITKEQFEKYIVSVRQMVVHELGVDYDTSRPIACYVDPWCGFGGGTVMINVPVRGSSSGEAYAVYGLHIRLREVAYRYSTDEK